MYDLTTLPDDKLPVEDKWDRSIEILRDAFIGKSNVSWIIGDISLYIIDMFGETALEQAIKEAGLDKFSLETAQRYMQVSKAFPTNIRNYTLTHRHHMVLQSVENKVEWLNRAEDENMSAGQLGLMVKAEKNPQILNETTVRFTSEELGRILDYINILKMQENISELDLDIEDKVRNGISKLVVDK